MEAKKNQVQECGHVFQPDSGQVFLLVLLSICFSNVLIWSVWLCVLCLSRYTTQKPPLRCSVSRLRPVSPYDVTFGLLLNDNFACTSQ